MSGGRLTCRGTNGQSGGVGWGGLSERWSSYLPGNERSVGRGGVVWGGRTYSRVVMRVGGNDMVDYVEDSVFYFVERCAMLSDRTSTLGR